MPSREVLLSCPLAVLAEADFEEHQQQGATQPEADQHKYEQLPGQARDQPAAEAASDRDRAT